MSDPLLLASGLSRSFGGVVALDGLDVQVAPGEVVAVVGPNGSGKSTLLDALTGTQRLDAGRILLGGIDVTGAPAARLARLGVARTFQNGRLLERLDALENVLLGLHAAPGLGWARGCLPWVGARRRACALAALAAVGLGPLWDRRVSTLSHGQRRRVELARALGGRRRLLVLDEPTSGLGTPDTAAIARLVLGAADGGCAVLLVEHDLDVVGEVAGRVLVLDTGRVVATGTPADVLADTGVARLLGEGRRAAERLVEVPA